MKILTGQVSIILTYIHFLKSLWYDARGPAHKGDPLTSIQYEVFDWCLYKHHTKTILAFFNISLEEWDLMIKAAALLTTKGELVEQEAAARTKLANIHMYLSGDRGGRFLTHKLGKDWLNEGRLMLLEMTPREALRIGHFDEVLSALRAMERVK